MRDRQREQARERERERERERILCHLTAKNAPRQTEETHARLKCTLIEGEGEEEENERGRGRDMGVA